MKACIIHGWGGSPDEPLHVWLKGQLEKRGWEVRVPAMPETDHPKIKPWIETLALTVKDFDEQDILIGHSIGCQTILRFTEKTNQSFGGAVFLAPWFELKNLEDKEWAVADPWVKTPIDFEKVRKKLPKISILLSDNDPYVPFEETKEAFDKLGMEYRIEHKKGHFTKPDGNVEILSSLLEAVQEVSSGR